MYCVYIKHGEIMRYTSFIEALFDVIDMKDNESKGLEIWWEDPA